MMFLISSLASSCADVLRIHSFFLPSATHLLFFHTPLHISAHACYQDGMPIVCPYDLYSQESYEARTHVSCLKYVDFRPLLSSLYNIWTWRMCRNSSVIQLGHHTYNVCMFQKDVDGCFRWMTEVSTLLAAEIPTWLDHPRPAADSTQPEELPGTRSSGSMVSIPWKVF